MRSASGRFPGLRRLEYNAGSSCNLAAGMTAPPRIYTPAMEAQARFCFKSPFPDKGGSADSTLMEIKEVIYLQE